jgi:hypothetical protein
MWVYVESVDFEMWNLKQDGVSLSIVRDHLDRDCTFTASIKRADGKVNILDARFTSLEAAQIAIVDAARTN